MISRRTWQKKKIDDLLNGTKKTPRNDNAPNSTKTKRRKQEEDELCWSIIKSNASPFLMKELVEKTGLSERQIAHFLLKNRSNFDIVSKTHVKPFVYSLKI